MIFLRLTRRAKTFFTRFGWLFAELLFVFVGLYGAFVFERMRDNELEEVRKNQILNALADEFASYEQELGTASADLDLGYAKPFFENYSKGNRPHPRPILYGGIQKVKTGIWDAMLQSGGIEVLEVEIIQQVQLFFIQLQDMLDLYARYERLYENLIMPELDQNTSFFYEPTGPELRDKYKWYVNQMFSIGSSLRNLTKIASETKILLHDELNEKSQDIEKPKKSLATVKRKPSKNE